ncbi:DUF72 domain-containing protein [Streptomyces sp. NPDC093093]|uniref:DUF72 domain-containing protein n=1 Tax=Streptomyces sp. NPDC093093 TaxID=3366025 RepID=UPI0038091279
MAGHTLNAPPADARCRTHGAVRGRLADDLPRIDNAPASAARRCPGAVASAPASAEVCGCRRQGRGGECRPRVRRRPERAAHAVDRGTALRRAVARHGGGGFRLRVGPGPQRSPPTCGNRAIPLGYGPTPGCPRRSPRWGSTGPGSKEESYRHTDTEAELTPWVSRVRAMSRQAGSVHVLFNNCCADAPVRAAGTMQRILGADPPSMLRGPE